MTTLIQLVVIAAGFLVAAFVQWIPLGWMLTHTYDGPFKARLKAGLLRTPIVHYDRKHEAYFIRQWRGWGWTYLGTSAYDVPHIRWWAEHYIQFAVRTDNYSEAATLLKQIQYWCIENER